MDVRALHCPLRWLNIKGEAKVGFSAMSGFMYQLGTQRGKNPSFPTRSRAPRCSRKKADVRKKEALTDGKEVDVFLEL